MTVNELIQRLQEMPQDADVMIEIEDECETCQSPIIRGACSLKGKWFTNGPYLHEASHEVRLRSY